MSQQPRPSDFSDEEGLVPVRTLSDGERLVKEGVANPTIMDLFTSGHDEITFEEDPRNPGHARISTRRSSRPSTGADLPDASYVPDPPCIMPFEDSMAEKFAAKAAQPTVPDYWKAYAGWLGYWPKIKEIRFAMEQFRDDWANKPPGSRLRAFVNVSTNSVGVRYSGTLDDRAKNGHVIAPGQCVAIEAMEEKEGNRFLKLPGPGAGWIFEHKDGHRVMSELRNIEVGMWWYRMKLDQPVEIRKVPDSGDQFRSAWIMSPKEVAVVDVRAKIGGCNFVHLFDGRGWVFERKPNTPQHDRNFENFVLTQCDDEFFEGGDNQILKNLVPPTNEVVEVGLWTYIVNLSPVLAIGAKKNGFFISPGAVMKVDKRSNSNGNPQGVSGPGIQNRMWLRLADGSGWVPETDEKGKKLMLLQTSDEVNYPSWYRPGADPNKDTEEWQCGDV